MGLEFKQPLVLAEGLAQSAVHHDMWYHEYLQAAEAKAIKAEEPALPLSALIDMERLTSKIRDSSGIYFHRQTRQHSGRWAMDQEIARDGVLKYSKAELVTLAARYRVAPPNLKQATAELINTAGQRLFFVRLIFHYLTRTSLPHSRGPTPPARMQIRFLPPPHHNLQHQHHHLRLRSFLHHGAEMPTTRTHRPLLPNDIRRHGGPRAKLRLAALASLETATSDLGHGLRARYLPRGRRTHVQDD